MISRSIDPRPGETSDLYAERLRALLIEERGFPKSTDPFGPIDYVASILYEYACKKKNQITLRWGKLSDEVAAEFRQMATRTVATWALEEMMATKAKWRLT